jgi:hypothetical protein
VAQPADLVTANVGVQLVILLTADTGATKLRPIQCLQMVVQPIAQGFRQGGGENEIALCDQGVSDLLAQGWILVELGLGR